MRGLDALGYYKRLLKEAGYERYLNELARTLYNILGDPDNVQDLDLRTFLESLKDELGEDLSRIEYIRDFRKRVRDRIGFLNNDKSLTPETRAIDKLRKEATELKAMLNDLSYQLDIERDPEVKKSLLEQFYECYRKLEAIENEVKRLEALEMVEAVKRERKAKAKTEKANVRTMDMNQDKRKDTSMDMDRAIVEGFEYEMRVKGLEREIEALKKEIKELKRASSRASDIETLRSELEELRRENKELYKLLVAMNNDNDNETSGSGPKRGSKGESRVKVLLEAVAKAIVIVVLGGLMIVSPILFMVKFPDMIFYLARALTMLGLSFEDAIVAATWTIVIILGLITKGGRR